MYRRRISLLLLALRCLGNKSETIITTVDPPALHPSISADWYTSKGCSVFITEPDFIFNCNQAGIFTLPRNDPSAILSDVVKLETGISGRIERVFPGSSPNRLLLLTKEASLDISPKWIVLELTISDDKTALKRVQIKPMFKFKGELEPEWLRMSQDRTWLIIVRKSDQFMMLMEVDMEALDYNAALGIENDKYQSHEMEVGSFSRDFDARENIFSYINTEGFFKQLKIE